MTIEELNRNKIASLKFVEHYKGTHTVECDLCGYVHQIPHTENWEITEIGEEIDFAMPILGIQCTEHDACKERQSMLKDNKFYEDNPFLESKEAQ